MPEIEFRDHWRDVPEHVAALVRGLETHRMTYEEAIRAAEDRLLSERLHDAQMALIHAHFEEADR